VNQRKRNILVSGGTLAIPGLLFGLGLSRIADGYPESQADRITSCAKQMKPQAVDQLLRFCLTAEADRHPELDGSAVDQDFELGTPLADVMSHREELLQDAANFTLEDVNDVGGYLGLALGLTVGSIILAAQSGSREYEASGA
jgi:hypothetical protein